MGDSNSRAEGALCSSPPFRPSLRLMTLTVAWLRNRSDVRELVMASDSRLSAGPERWDTSPKVLTFARTDMAMSFTGTTEFTYPAMLQLNRALETHPAMVERRFDVTQVAALFEDILNQMVAMASTTIGESLDDTLVHTRYLLGGFSWKIGEFRIWEFAWDRGEALYRKNRRRFSGARSNRHTVWFLGDGALAARTRLQSLLSDGFTRPPTKGLDMEPLQVLEEAISDVTLPSVGGAPQVVKLYRHLNVEPFSVIWPRNGGQPTFAGRPLLEYEKAFAPPLSLESPDRHYRYLAGEIATGDDPEAIGE